MNKGMFLSELTNADLDKNFLICQLAGSEEIQSRLVEMGLIPGAELRFLGRAPFAGAFLFQLHTSYLALRYEEAKCAKIQNT